MFMHQISRDQQYVRKAGGRRVGVVRDTHETTKLLHPLHSQLFLLPRGTFLTDFYLSAPNQTTSLSLANHLWPVRHMSFSLPSFILFHRLSARIQFILPKFHQFLGPRNLFEKIKYIGYLENKSNIAKKKNIRRCLVLFLLEFFCGSYLISVSYSSTFGHTLNYQHLQAT